MGVDDRGGLAAHVVSQDDKLSRTFGVPVHASGQNVSQVWQAGPLRVRLEERQDDGTWLVVDVASWWDLQRWAEVVCWEDRGVVHWVRARGGFELAVPLTPALDRFLVELVDVIADVRRAAGTVQLEFEDLVEQGDREEVCGE